MKIVNRVCTLSFSFMSILALSGSGFSADTVIKDQTTNYIQIAPTFQPIQPIVPTNKLNTSIQSLTQSNAVQVITGKVIGVLSGDIFKIQTPLNSGMKVRLAGTASPVKYQAFSDLARTNLFKKIIDKEITVTLITKSPGGTVIVNAYCGNKWINREMVEEGWAWYYPPTLKSQELSEAQRQAKSKKLGLWVDESAQPPWKFDVHQRLTPADHTNHDNHNEHSDHIDAKPQMPLKVQK
jgi:micrococcal nuclease